MSALNKGVISCSQNYVLFTSLIITEINAHTCFCEISSLLANTEPSI
jgi:hypothetical protein